MEFIMACIFVSIAALIAFFVGYAITTNDVIRTQEKQIARLRTDNFRLQAALKKKSNTRIVEIHDSRVDEENIPEFNNI